MKNIFEWIIKLLVILMLAPCIVGIAFQIIGGILAAILPWLILAGAVMGASAGLTASLFLRRRLPPPDGAPLPRARLEGEPIRRPRGRRPEE